MCGILDASVAGEVFIKRPKLAAQPPTAGEKFLIWIKEGPGHLVVGGKLRNELGKVNLFQEWAREAQLSGKLHSINDERVNEKTAKLEAEGKCRSNDPHVIALAQIGGARLLYTNDKRLQGDFTNEKLISNPRGLIYETPKNNKKFTVTHKELLNRKDLCLLKG